MMKKYVNFYKKGFSEENGQAMVEYTTVAAVLAIGLTVSTPVFSMMSSALMTYLNGIQTLLNYPLP